MSPVTRGARQLQALVLNAGSSSLKYGLYDLVGRGKLAPRASGQVDRIGGGALGAVSVVLHSNNGETIADRVTGDFKNHSESLSAVMKILQERAELSIACVGHRVVHGGQSFSGAVVVDTDVEAAIEEANELAPLHNPHCLNGIRVAREMFDVPQVAVFDTAFHMSLPPAAYTYAIPRELAEKHGVRRYGFHGINYSYVSRRAAEFLGKPLKDINIIACHLGAGASMACIEKGICVDTTMGLTPLEGLPMSIRSGDIDPGAIFHLAHAENLSIDQLNTLLNKESGFKGMCGMSDMRSIRDAIAMGDLHAKLARDVFIHRIRKYLGAFNLRLNGDVDAVVFTGGVGENDSELRDQVCSGLASLGIEVDPLKNQSQSNGMRDVQSVFSRTDVLVIPADEEQEIAMQAVHATGLQVEEVPPAVDSAFTEKTSHDRVGQIYLAPMTEDTGLVTATFGILGSLMSRGYIHPGATLPFLPIAKSGQDPFIKRLAEYLQLKDVPLEQLYGVTKEEAQVMVDEGRDSDLVDAVVAKFQALRSRGAAFMLVVGSNTLAGNRVHKHYELSEALGMEFVGVLNIKGVKAEDVMHHVSSILSLMDEPHFHSLIINQIPKGTDMKELDAVLKKRDVEALALVPHSSDVEQVTACEIATLLGGQVRYGRDSLERVPMQRLLAGTLDVPGTLQKIYEYGPGVMLVTHSDRCDLVMGILGAIRSRHLPPISGILLTGGGPMHQTVENILSNLEAQNAIPVPIISAPKDTIQTVNAITTARYRILDGGQGRIERTQALFDRHLNTEAVEHILVPEESRPELPMTPKLFQWQIMAAARSQPQNIVLPEGSDPRVLTAAGELLRRGLCKVTILGAPDKIMDMAAGMQLDLSRATLIDPEQYPHLQAMAEELYEARKHKGMTLDSALYQLVTNPNTFGTMMMKRGDADGMVSGAIHTTADTMRPALQIIKCAPGAKMVSSAFFMLLDGGAKVFADCAIVENPTSEELAEIGAASAVTAASFGLKPRVAMLSYATGTSNTGPMIEKVRTATELLRNHPSIAGLDIAVEGPIQFDAAVDPAIANVKYKGNPGPVAGRANVCVFPDLNAGNNAYKAVQQASGCLAVGPIMQGLRMPVNDLSRGCTVDDIVNTVVMTCIQAISARRAC